MTGAIRRLLARDRRFGLVVRARASSAEAALAEQVIDRSGVAVQLERLLEDARPGGSGRPRDLPVRTLLVALLTLATAGQPLHLRRAVELLTNLPPSTRRRLHVERPDGKLVTERQLVYLFKRICQLLDTSAHTAPDLADDVRAQRRELLQQTTDRLLGATLPDERTSGSYALDATTVPSWARGWGSVGRRRDHDAGWSVKRADGSTAIDAPPAGDTKPRRRKGRSRDEFVYGYETHLATWVRDDGQPGGTVPALTERIMVFGGGKSDIDHITATLVGMLAQPAAVQPSGDILVDRWYTQQRAGRFTLPLRRAGAGLVFDFKADQAGPDGSYRGALKVDGDLYCPAMPSRLHQLPDAHYKNRTQLDAREQHEAKRAPWRMLPLANETADGFQRMQCPAERNKVRCPLKAASLTLPMADAPTVTAPPGAPGDCCTQKTVTVPPAVNAGTRQKHPWGSTAWRTSYNRRNVVEGAIGVLKTAGGTDVKRDHIRVMGLTAHTLLMAFAVAGTNLQLHARHLERTDAAASEDGTAVELEDAFTPGGYDQLIATTAGQVAAERARKTGRQGADPPAA